MAANLQTGTNRLIPLRVWEAAEQFVGRGWVLERVVNWLDHGPEQLFLLTGAPGSGKSTLGAWLAGAGPLPAAHRDASMLSRVRSAWSAVHFCSARGHGGSIDPRRFIESLTRQLADRHEDFAVAAIRNVTPEYNIHLDVRENWGQVLGVRTQNLIVTGVSTADAYAAAVREPLRRLLEDRADARVAILVDGLDEALVPMVPNIVTLLASSGDIHGDIRYLLTTRNEHRVLDLLADRFDGVRHLDLSAEETAWRAEADIRTYVARRLADDQVRHHDRGHDRAVETLISQARGNFLYADMLLREVADGKRRLGDLSGLPHGLHSLYRAYLDRVMPGMEQYGSSAAWLTHYQPLLGSLSVASRPVPRGLMARWLQWDESEVAARIDDLNQLLEFDPRDGGGHRIFHQSLADFLASDRYRDNGSERSNSFFISPKDQHDRLITFYLTSVRTVWRSDWAGCDTYGLRQLARHMQARLLLTDSPEQQRQQAENLYALVLDAGFQSAQRQRLGDEAVADSFRAALEVALVRHDLDQTERLLTTLATATAVELRGLAVQGLVQLHEQAPRAAIELIKSLLTLQSSDVWGVGLKAAYVIGAQAMDVFRWAVLGGSPELRQAVSYALYLWWRRQPGGLTLDVLRDLSTIVSLRRPRQTRRTLEVMTTLSITIYLNHCEQREIVEQGSKLWREVYCNRLHLDAVPPLVAERLLSQTVATMFTKRVAEALLVAELQDPAQFFASPAEDKARFRRVVALLDPKANVQAQADDLRTMLHADVLLFRFTAAVTIGVHAYLDFPAVRPMLERLFEDADGQARMWELLGFAVLLPSTPPAWTELLERFTTRLLEENRESLEQDGFGPGGALNVTLLPLGLAYGKAGGAMPRIKRLIRQEVAKDDALVHRLVDGLGAVGFYYPQAVLHTLQEFLPELVRRPALQEGLVGALAVIRVLHVEAVDLFLRQEGIEHLQPQVSARSDVDLVRRLGTFIGFINENVHIALHHPKMRRHFLLDLLNTLTDSRDVREFIRRFTPVPIRMLREADYELARWTLPE